MKNLRNILMGMSATVLAAVILCSAAPNGGDSAKTLKINIVNFKTCVEQSKMGKQEQANFEALKKQMETSLEEKEKVLSELSNKFNDPDYLDSLSAEAETDLKRKFRALNQELSAQQNQYYQTLQQTNFKVVQKLNDSVTKAANAYAKDNKIDVILNEESAFFYSPDLDISSKVVAAMDQQFDKEASEPKNASDAKKP